MPPVQIRCSLVIASPETAPVPVHWLRKFPLPSKTSIRWLSRSVTYTFPCASHAPRPEARQRHGDVRRARESARLWVGETGGGDATRHGDHASDPASHWLPHFMVHRRGREGSRDNHTYRRLTYGEEPVWLADGRRIIYTNRGRLSVFDMVSGASREVLAVPGESLGIPILTADNSQLFSSRSTSEGDIWVVRFGETPRPR